MAIQLFAGANIGPFISAHRGYSSDYPENTIPALQGALDAGAHVAEIDVRLTRDGKLVLMHDAKVDRTTDGSGPVEGHDACGGEEARCRPMVRPQVCWHGGSTLDDVLDWSKGRLGILIEMKNYPERAPAFVDEVIATILRHNAQDFAIPAGFDHATLAEIHRRQPNLRLEMILHCRLADHVHAARAADPSWCLTSRNIA
jgi:Glycerophosphoryl diester phosphodiesterase